MKNLLFLTVFLGPLNAFAADAVKTIPAQKTLSAEGGRFVFGQISDARRDQYMLDTKTGRLWQIVEFSFPKKDDGTTPKPVALLQPIRYLDKNENVSAEPNFEK